MANYDTSKPPPADTAEPDQVKMLLWSLGRKVTLGLFVFTSTAQTHPTWPLL